MTYYRLGSQKVWELVLYYEKGSKVVARFRAGERLAAMEEVLEKLGESKP